MPPIAHGRQGAAERAQTRLLRPEPASPRATGASCLDIAMSKPLRRRLSRRLVRAARDPGRCETMTETMTVGELIDSLGDRSFGWCLVLFALINMIPMPPGGNMVTSIPLWFLVGQMAMGARRLRLPGFVTRRRIGRKGFQKLVLRMAPVIRPLERVVRPRHPGLFSARSERLLGIYMLAVTLALFMPVPFSGYIPATALLVIGFGLVERDGLVVIAGIVFGILAILITAAVMAMLLLGVHALAT
jgi:hypothetical protein